MDWTLNITHTEHDRKLNRTLTFYKEGRTFSFELFIVFIFFILLFFYHFERALFSVYFIFIHCKIITVVAINCQLLTSGYRTRLTITNSPNLARMLVSIVVAIQTTGATLTYYGETRGIRWEAGVATQS